MPKPTDITVKAATLYFLPIKNRVPLKFGNATLNSVTCARVSLRVENRRGQSTLGWGETPLSVQWVWPSTVAYELRHAALKEFSVILTDAWARFPASGHPIEVGSAFLAEALPQLMEQFNSTRRAEQQMPWLAALVCCSAFDLALHDAYGMANGISTYQTYTSEFMNRDLAGLLEPAADTRFSFQGRYPADYLTLPAPATLPAWHLVGGKDAIDRSELDGSEPNDGYPVLLEDWIRRDGLFCLKIKLCGNDSCWDYERVVKVGRIAIETGVCWLTADFNCTVADPAYVNEILDRLLRDEPRIYGMILYVEQPFPYEIETNRIDVHSVSARKPLFMDESAHDWRHVRTGRQLGWTGVALKTCKTQTGALLSLCWARQHGMTLMVQDLTNPMLAQVPHVLLAAHANTIMGVETNAMQFYPEASALESRIHPGIYQRRHGRIDLSTISGPGFGYGPGLIQARTLPDPSADTGS